MITEAISKRYTVILFNTHKQIDNDEENLNILRKRKLRREI